jgi:hypothetical protein
LVAEAVRVAVGSLQIVAEDSERDVGRAFTVIVPVAAAPVQPAALVTVTL